MNVSELARKLKINTKKLLEILPAVGFDIGRRAIKVDNVIAKKIINQWPELIRRYRNQQVHEEVVDLKEMEEKEKQIRKDFYHPPQA